MPRPEFPIDVDRQLVWMTCGSDAGYQTLLSPASSQASWYEVLESAFPGLEIGQQGAGGGGEHVAGSREPGQ